MLRAGLDRPRHAHIPHLIGDMILTGCIQILDMMVIVLQQRDRTDRRPAVVKDIHLCPPGLVKGHPVVHLHPAGNALVVAPAEVHPMPRRDLLNTLPALGVPDGRIGHAGDHLALQPAMLRLDPVDLREHLVRRPLNPGVRLPRTPVQL